MTSKFVLGALASAALAVTANAVTIATFADPAADGTTPLFHFNTTSPATGTISGGWSGLGLTLETPGTPSPDFPNARFTMAPVSASSLVGLTVWSLGPGAVNFVDSIGNPLMTITFQGGTLISPVGVGSSDFSGFGVTFSGPIVPPGNPNEAFAFSFANPVGNFNDYTVTSSFTSSAVPEPTTVGLLAIGALALLRRRS